MMRSQISNPPMPAETLELLYPVKPRGNRRRPKHPMLRACTGVVLWIVAVGIVIAVLMKLGVFQAPVRPVYVAMGFALSTNASASIY